MNTRTMVNSGATWIGDIPSNWNVKKIKNIALVSKGSQYDFDPLANPGQIPYINGGINPSWYSSKSNREPNLIAISEGGASAGYVQKVTSPWWCGAHCYSVKPSQQIDQNFIFWSLKAGEVVLQDEKTGTAMPNLQSGKLLNLAIPMTCLSEQQSIANFLDHHVNLIDCETSLIDKKIELLGEKRKSLIFECVTGKRTVVQRSSLTDGQNAVCNNDWVSVPTGNEKMIHSGIDWIGLKPSDWTSIRLKDAGTWVTGKNPPEQGQGVVPVYGSSSKAFSVTQNYLDVGPVIAIGRKGTIDKPFEITGEFWAVDTCMYNKIEKGVADFSFIKHFAQIIPWLEISTKTALPSHTQTQVSNICIVCPTLLDQKTIGDFLNKETTLIDKEISLLQRKQDILIEKRKALIFEAVTGKIDCRSWTL